MNAEPGKIINPMDGRIPVQYDGPLSISLGKSRFETSWKNQAMHWSRLLYRLSRSRETNETHAEYMRMPKAEQDRIKDIGGFVGGHLKEGKRRTGAVACRQIITLDADFAPADLWDQLMEKALDDPLLAHAMAVYSTHKHTTAKPRLRLIIPLDREVSPDEYEAIARRIAERIGIDYFDDSTYQPTRLMYWPSHSADVEPFFEVFDAPFLPADDVLGTYPDWADVSYWPFSSRMSEIQRKSAAKQGDPLQKKGLVGIFCRTYTVTKAIRTFLPDVYTPTAKENRWTYAAGSTAAGLVVYDGDSFAYSNHSTDPAGGQLCNAFDLVRIHKFGHLDEDTSTDTPMNRRPSWKAMTDLIGDDILCKRTRDAEAAADFGQAPAEGEDWQQKLLRNENLTLKAALVNATLILENDAELQGIRLNEMTDQIEATDLPWEDGKVGWSDRHVSILTDWVARKYGVEFAAAKMRMALDKVSYDRRFHPVRDYLDGLPAWDGTVRVDRLLIDYLMADDTLYVREATRKAMMAAVARVYVPGIKFDSMLVLVGPQGAGKSGLFTSLAGDWFTDSLKLDMMNDVKRAGEQLQGKWLVEIGEMSGIKKAEIESVKSFLSRRVESYRDAFGHYRTDKPRQCIIVGSTNQEEGFLRDVTGNRRFWPVTIRKPPRVLTWDMPRDTIDQIWAEAKILWETDGNLQLSREAEIMAEDAQREAMESDERQGLVEEYLDRLLPEGWDAMSPEQRSIFLESDEVGTVRRTEVSNIEIWTEVLQGSGTRMEPKDSFAIAKIMAKVDGWRRTGRRKHVTGYGQQRVYEREKNDK